jgi:hypothetical protein
MPAGRCGLARGTLPDGVGEPVRLLVLHEWREVCELRSGLDRGFPLGRGPHGPAGDDHGRVPIQAAAGLGRYIKGTGSTFAEAFTALSGKGGPIILIAKEKG